MIGKGELKSIVFQINNSIIFSEKLYLSLIGIGRAVDIALATARPHIEGTCLEDLCYHSRQYI
jgi:hypothetical protein